MKILFRNCFGGISAAALLLSFVLTPSLRAQNQNPNAQVQGQQFQKDQPLLSKWQEDDEDDFGKILTLKKSKLWWVAPYASARGYWTSNALLTSGPGEKGDSVFVETQGVNGGYHISDDWSVQAGYNYQLTRYSENPVLDTDGHNLEFSTSYQLPWHWQLGAGDRGMWLDAPHQGTQIYRENNPYVNLIQSWDFFQNRLSCFYGYEYDRKYAHPVTFDRDEHTVFSGASYLWKPNLVSQLVLRQSWQLYDAPSFTGATTGRQEWVSTVVVQTVWQPLNWLQVSAFGLTGYDNSINSTRDYKVANAGGEIRLFWKF